MNTVTPEQLATLFVQALSLEDVCPAEIDLAAPLFGSGLGLDSLDLLEIALVIQQHFGIKIKADDPEVDQIFGSLNSLAEFINSASVQRD
jgi:acyl carrier protein